MSRVLFSLAIVVALAAVSSALSCARCRPEQLENCPQLSCPKSERVIAAEACQCCEVCTRKVGEKCTERQPCDADLHCYTLDRNPQLPWFFNGICVTNETYHSLPAEPTPCNCEMLLWEQRQRLQAVNTPTLPPFVTATDATLEAITATDATLEVIITEPAVTTAKSTVKSTAGSTSGPDSTTAAPAEVTKAIEVTKAATEIKPAPPAVPVQLNDFFSQSTTSTEQTSQSDAAFTTTPMFATSSEGFVEQVEEVSYSPTTKDVVNRKDDSLPEGETETTKPTKGEEGPTASTPDFELPSDSERVESFFRWLKGQFNGRQM